MFAASAVLSLNVYAQIPKEDVLECGLPSGSKFVLKSKYLWIPLNLNPRSSKTRERNESFRVYYKKKNSLKSDKLSTTLPGQTLETADQGEYLCMTLGELANNVYTRDAIVSRARGNVYPLGSSYNRLIIGVAKEDRPKLSIQAPPFEADAPIRLHHGDGAIIRNNRIIIKGHAHKRAISTFDTGTFTAEKNVLQGMTERDEIVKAFIGKLQGNISGNTFVSS
jgi:hypothetical protein